MALDLHLVRSGSVGGFCEHRGHGMSDALCGLGVWAERGTGADCFHPLGVQMFIPPDREANERHAVAECRRERSPKPACVIIRSHSGRSEA